MKHELFTFKYEPQTYEEMILDPVIKGKLEKAFEEVPNLLLIGPPGVGKGTFTNIFLRRTKLDSIKINCSDETSIENIRSKVKSFATALGITDKKVVVLNESDFLSLNAQAMLRDLMEQVQSITRFIFLCNYGYKMIPELQSRCQVIELNNPPINEIGKFIKKIIIAEKIKVEHSDEIIALIKTYYPDIRRIINTLQFNVVNGKIEHIKMDSINSVYDDIFKNIKTGDMNEIRKIIRSNAIIYPELYQYLFENVGDFKNPGDAIILIGEHMYRDSIACIKEINFIAMVAKIIRDGIV
jgi:DNA polymerase III delta prime subunit